MKKVTSEAKVKKVWVTPKLKDVPIFFEVSLYAATR
jgi:hypothetical protein